jgi:hypothetical protein
MLVGFLGDLHNRVFHGLAVLLEWQRRAGRRFALVVQVGDLGVPEPDPNARFKDEADGHFRDFLGATGRRAASLHRTRSLLANPVLFLRGNHEDPAWLAGLPADGHSDRFDLFRYATDGTLLELDGWRLGLIGGVEPVDPNDGPETAVDRAAADRLLAAGRLDVLVTHDGPYGIGTSYYGKVQGSPVVTELVERLRPRFHVAGHYHHLIGPKPLGGSTYLGLDGIVASPRWFPEKTGLQPGCLAVLDTATGQLEPVLDGWLEEFDRRFDFDAFVEAL